MPVTKHEVALELAEKDDLLLQNLVPVRQEGCHENLIKCGAFDSLYNLKIVLAALPKSP